MTKSELEKKIKMLQEQINSLKKDLMETEEQYYDLVYTENTASYLESIYSVSPENSINEHLYSDTKTTPIMDSFYCSKKDFLIFKSLFFVDVDFPPYWQYVSIVVRKSPRSKIRLIDSGLTMTDLKKESGWATLKYCSESRRVYPLIKEIVTAATKLSETNKIVPFEHIIRLGGQTYANQTGFGSEYNGEELVHQGTLYGETTGFYIIGISMDQQGLVYG